MGALLFIQQRRRAHERIELVAALRTAQLGPKEYERQMERWARDAEIPLRFEE